jgi:hypothetical protein
LINFVGNYLDKLRSDQSLQALAIVTTLVARHTSGGIDDNLDDHRLAMDVWRQQIKCVIKACDLRSDVTADHALFGLLALLTGATLEASTDPAHLPDQPTALTIATAAIRGWITKD